MSESTTSILISAGLLLVLALFVPCMESLAGLLRRGTQRTNAPSEQQKVQNYKRDIA